MKWFEPICLGLAVLATSPLWSQADPTPPEPAATGQANTKERMLTPPPVSSEDFTVSPLSEARSNYLGYGVAFNSAYSDNALGAINGHAVSDVSYSVWPTVALDETTSRLHWLLTYAPGFTFYQHTSSRNEADQNLAIDFQYRLSPHVTFTARDGLQKSSNYFNQPDMASASVVSGSTLATNQSVIAPIADRLGNAGSAGLTYQFSANGMIGGSGTFSNLRYPNPAQVPGLYDSSSQGGLAFYTNRLSQVHYIGVTYQYQRLVSYPTGGDNETQTHAVLFFYSLYPTLRFSLSFFGGPQYSDTLQAPLPPALTPVPQLRMWKPAAGASLGWQGHMNSFALSYSHLVRSGWGLVGAVQTDSASASMMQQITKTLSGSVAGGYAQNNVLGSALVGNSNGHSVSGTASLQQRFGQHLNLQLGYTRLHQSYSEVAVISLTPDTNREFVSLSYQFSRPLGR